MKKGFRVDYLRYVGNALTLIGYAILINVDPIVGSIIKLIGVALILPSCYKLKLYDVMFMFGVYTVIDLTNIIRLLTGG